MNNLTKVSIENLICLLNSLKIYFQLPRHLQRYMVDGTGTYFQT